MQRNTFIVNNILSNFTIFFVQWLIEGINSVKTDYCCIINADGSMNPKYLKEMRSLCSTKDFIFTSRYQKPGGGSDDDDITTSIGNFFFTVR